MIRFIDEHRDQFGVEAVCCVLSVTECGFITSRGYRAAKARPASARTLRDEVLLPEIRRIHSENYSVYGVRKMHHAMRRAGWDVGRDQVARLMRAADLQAVRRGRKPVTTRPAQVPDARPDLVERRFTADRPHRLWVADITYVRILARFCYVAFITDVCTRKIVGWAVSATLHTDGLPLLALEHALLTSGAVRSENGLIHHSDRGAQYVSLAVLVGDVDQSCEGRLVPAGRVRPVLVVVVQPGVKLAPALGFAGVAAGVGPAICEGAVEPLDLAVSLRPIRAGSLVSDAKLRAGVAPQV